MAVAPQPLGDCCQALATNPFCTLEALTAEASDLARREIRAIKDLP
ncbi:MAG: hypothetical protein AW07_03599 [Candidatus Accumulibacter sp. SK-11]|nr:MAG: hypothetical protein AW07_03599 [Candidatus Accumulibacter sp. SK-11]